VTAVPVATPERSAPVETAVPVVTARRRWVPSGLAVPVAMVVPVVAAV
jgi:hypothetical protein